MSASTGPVANYTTGIPATQSLTEMTQMLAASGAASVTTEYDGGTPTALRFTIATPHGPRWFTLPANVDGVLELLSRKQRAGAFKAARKKYDTREQAERVAWRVLRDWLRAQLTLVDAGLVNLTTAMLAHVHADDEGHTLAELYAEREQAALTTGGS